MAALGSNAVPLTLQVGISTGSLVVVNMGSASAQSFTVMGDTVNIASRLKGASQQYGVTALLSEAAKSQLGEAMATRELDLIQVVGKADPIRIYELLGPQDSLTDTVQTAHVHFAQGVAAYRQRDWTTAHEQLEACLALKPDDRPAQIYCDRIQTLAQTPPAPDWTGVWQLTEK